MARQKGNRRVVRFRANSFQVVLDPSIVNLSGIKDGDIVEQIVTGTGSIMLRKTGDRMEKPGKEESNE